MIHDPFSRRALLYVTPTVFKEALHIPENTEILSAEWDAVSSQLRLLVWHPSFPEVPEGVPADRAILIITKHATELSEATVYTYTSEWK